MAIKRKPAAVPGSASTSAPQAASITPAPAAPASSAPPELVFLASPADLGRAILASRTSRGLSLSALAANARVGRRFVRELENGKPTAHLGKALTVMTSAGLVGIVVPVEALQAGMG